MSYEPKVNDIFRQIGKNDVYATKRKVLAVSKGKVSTITVNDVFGDDGRLEVIELRVVSDFYEKMYSDDGSYIPQVGDIFRCIPKGIKYVCERRDSDFIYCKIIGWHETHKILIDGNKFEKVG